MMRPTLLAISCLALSIFTASCSDGSSVDPTSTSFIDSQSIDLINANETTSSTDLMESDAGPYDVEDTANTDTESAVCEPGSGCFGESCADGSDCLSGICSMHLGDNVCSKTCDTTCPSGWSCKLVTSGGDGQYVCVSNYSHLCLPCTNSATCSGGTPGACIRYPEGMGFCGGNCDIETPCPSGYACQQVTTTEGVSGFQCVATAGVCNCSNLAISSLMATSCEVSNDQGSCIGARACTEDGLLPCDAIEPSVEVCNGIDDDCDGLVDELTCDDGDQCTEDACAGEAGCSHTPLPEGECLDGDACTIGDHCENGTCVGTPIDCDDGNPCTEDSCNGLGGCATTPVTTVCDDGDPCTLGDLCIDGSCKGSAGLNCDDNNVCTDDSCGANGCVYTPNALSCEDGNACTDGDTCNLGECKGNQVDCNDGNLCTLNGCDAVDGCLSIDQTVPCTDGNICTIDDTCIAGTCASGWSLECKDGNPCTDDGCDGALGCTFTANEEECDDNNFCTTGDTCSEGVCAAQEGLTCDDGKTCTSDTCLPGEGCVYTLIEGDCDDGNVCTNQDICSDGNCVGTPIACADGDDCTLDSCDPQKGCVAEPILPCCGNAQVDEGEVCDDGNTVDGDGCEGSCTEFTALDITFTTCGTEGVSGPDQAACSNAYQGIPGLDGKVTVVAGKQSWQVPYSGKYRLRAYGAAGWNAGDGGGKGAIMRGTFALIEGDVITILVGQKGNADGPSGAGLYGGGGGATYVANAAQEPLLVAGGGGGQDNRYALCSAMHASDGQAGQNTCDCSTPTNGGVDGQGGEGTSGGGGGGGFYSNGGDVGGQGFLQGGVGGSGAYGNGGFGGGGGTNDDQGGAGGGYSGGAGCGENGNSGGGGSFNTGSDPDNAAGANIDHGKLEIIYLSP